jgi:hypothetical protein
MKDRLPDYLVERKKQMLSEGSGYERKRHGAFLSDIAKDKISDDEFRELKRKYPEWNITDKETAYYFTLFADNLFTKAGFNKERPFRFLYRYTIRGRVTAFLSNFLPRKINPLSSS